MFVCRYLHQPWPEFWGTFQVLCVKTWRSGSCVCASLHEKGLIKNYEKPRSSGTLPCVTWVGLLAMLSSLPAERGAYGQTTEKCGRRNWIFWQFLRNLCRNCVELYSVLGQGVITRNRLSVRCDYERNCRAPLEVLPRLFTKVGIKSLDATGKSRSIMFRTERLNDETRVLRFVGQLTPQLLPIPLSRLCAWLRWVREQDRIHKNVTRLVVESEKFEVLDRIRRSLLGTRDDELRDRRAAQCRRARN